MSTSLAKYVFSEPSDTIQVAADIPATPDLILKMMRTLPVSFLVDDGNDIDIKDPAAKRLKTAHEDAPDAITHHMHGDSQRSYVTVVIIIDSDDEYADDDSGDDPSEDSDDESAEE